MNEQMNQTGGGVCGCKHHKIMPIGIIVLGVLFIIDSFGPATWPMLVSGIVLIAMGIMKMKSHACKCC